MKRKIWMAIGLIALGYGAVRGYRAYSFYQEMTFWTAEMGHGEGRLSVGDAAPDFDLQYKKSEERVRLSAFRGDRPVALVFGSYT